MRRAAIGRSGTAHPCVSPAVPVGEAEAFQPRARPPPDDRGCAGVVGAFHSVQLGSILWHMVSRLVFRRHALERMV